MASKITEDIAESQEELSDEEYRDFERKLDEVSKLILQQTQLPRDPD